MTSIAEIAKKAFDAVYAKLPEVIQVGELTKKNSNSYNTATGEYENVSSDAFSCRVLIDTSSAIQDSFPAHTIGPKDVLLYLEGLASAPEEGDIITVSGFERTIVKTGDIVGVGTFFVVVAQ